jgi:hypothetical protein
MEDVMGKALADLDDDRLSRKRRYFIVALAVVVIIMNNAVNLVPEAAQMFDLGAARTIDSVLMIGFWVAPLYLIGTVAGGNARNPVLNDELTKAHRSTALKIGYWCLLAALALGFAWSRSGRHVFDPAATERFIMTVVSVGSVIPALVFAILERRAEKGG